LSALELALVAVGAIVAGAGIVLVAALCYVAGRADELVERATRAAGPGARRAA